MGVQKTQKMGEKENCRILFFNKAKKKKMKRLVNQKITNT